MTAAIPCPDKPRNAAATDVAPRRLLRDRAYLAWFGADTGVHAGHGISSVALPLLVAGTAASPSVAGAVVAAFSGGSLVGLLPGGLLADRYDRRRLVPALSLVVMLACGALAWCATRATGLPGLLAAAAALLGLGWAGLGPSMTATLKRLVRPEEFARAAGAAEGRSAVLALAAPALAGLLVGVGATVPFVVAATCALLGAAAYVGIPRQVTTPERRVARASEAGAGWRGRVLAGGRELTAGVRMVVSHPVLRVLLAAGTLANLATSLVVMASIFELRRAGVAPVIIGSMSSLVAIGSLVGAVASAALGPRVPGGRVVLGSLIWVALCLSPLTVTTAPGAVVAALGAAVVAGPPLNAVLGGCLVAMVPDEVQGRTDGAVALVASCTTPLAPLAAGGLLQAFGYRSALLAGVALVALALLTVVTSRDLRRLGRPQDWR